MGEEKSWVFLLYRLDMYRLAVSHCSVDSSKEHFFLADVGKCIKARKRRIKSQPKYVYSSIFPNFGTVN